MKRLFGIAAKATAFLVLLSHSAANASDWTRLFAAEDLARVIATDAQVQVVDIRAEKYVEDGTIPGAIALNYKSLRGPKERPGLPPSADKLSEVLSDAGFHLDRPFVVVNHKGSTMHMGQAAYVYWLLKSAGAETGAILSGGFKGWKSEGLPIAESPLVPKPSIADVEYTLDWWADPLTIVGIATKQLDGAILDARFEAQVKRAAETGKPLTSIPYARYIPTSLIAPTLTLDDATEEKFAAFRAELEDRGINLNGDVIISVCQTGELSALSWFYASEIVGIQNIQYYPDAIQGWVADGGILFGLPVQG